jgi:5,10-methylenetetrahydromethanopterin reductase
MAMDYGIFLAPFADSWKIVKRAEALGYRRAWFYDTQLLNAELFVSMAAAAVHTSTIRLATGVLIPSNRIAPVTASALASLNALAPGRIDFGISTGFTARRTLGLGPVKLGDMEEYVRVVRGLLARETLEWTLEGHKRKIRFLNPEVGAINLDDPIPLHVAAMGPRARRLAAKLGAGLVHATGSVAHAGAGIADMQAAWREAGRDPADLHATAAIGGSILHEGEAADSPRAKPRPGRRPPSRSTAWSSARPSATSAVPCRRIPPAARALSPDLSRLRAGRRAYLSNHRGHLMFLRPEEHEVCTAELIRATTFTASRDELRERIRALGAAGFSHLGIMIRHGHPEMLEEWAELLNGV